MFYSAAPCPDAGDKFSRSSLSDNSFCESILDILYGAVEIDVFRGGNVGLNKASCRSHTSSAQFSPPT